MATPLPSGFTTTRLDEPRLGQATSGTACTASATDCSNPAGIGIAEGNLVDFASTALWAVIVATIIVALLLGAALYYVRRRKRIRMM